MEELLNKIKRLMPKKLFKALQPAYHFLLSWFSAFVYGWPSEKLIVIGVTGTTGKTTSVYLMAKMLEKAGFKVGYTSTAMFNNGKREWLNDKKMTMVGRFFTQRVLRNMLRNRCQYAIIETTSEGIRQFRHRFINYDILVFTGLYSEHIESHGSFENYKKTKGKLFEHLKRCKVKYINEQKQVANKLSGIKKIDLNRVKKTAIVNGDDEHADYFLDFWSEEKIIYTRDLDYKKELKDVLIIDYQEINISKEGTSFKIRNKKINLQLLGDFNATNAMNAVCLGISQRLGIDEIKKGLEEIKGVPGRLEKIDQGQDFTVIIDYAFEPRALEKLYEIIKLIPHNNVIHVLGSTGGGRDIARRPKLGKLAGEKADYVIVTNEDPYDDDPQTIIEQVSQGVDNKEKKINNSLFKILDRGEAIKKALSLAKQGDMVLITGKGSEQAICVANGEKIEWDDRVMARNELELRLKNEE
ncbi:MAG: UDP-N-acetylmuramyl-tripeptide synthetase [Patescibacteria group bacterium]